MISLILKGEVTEVPYAAWRDPRLQDLIGRYRAPGLTDEERTARLHDVRKRMHALVDTLRGEAEAHADMLVEALDRLPPVSGAVFRAGWELWPGRRVTFSCLLYTSQSGGGGEVPAAAAPAHRRPPGDLLLGAQGPQRAGHRVLLPATGREGGASAARSGLQDRPARPGAERPGRGPRAALRHGVGHGDHCLSLASPCAPRAPARGAHGVQAPAPAVTGRPRTQISCALPVY